MESLEEFNLIGGFQRYSDNEIYTIPIKPHIIRRSDGTGGLTYSALLQELDSVNFFYENAGVQFKICDTVGYLFDTKFSTLNTPEEEALLTVNSEDPRVINIYFADTLLLAGTRVCGFAYFPPGPNLIFIDNTCVNWGNTLTHELGHFFSLVHTHGLSNTELTEELVDGSNCAITADNICDTPADPNLDGNVVYSPPTGVCTYTGTAVDANGASFQPQVHNIMSYGRPECMDTLSDQQYLRIRNSLFYHGRVDLICTPDNAVIDDHAITSVYPNPFTSSFTVQYSLKSSANVSLTMYDLLGRKLRDIYSGSEKAGYLKQYHAVGDTKIGAGIYYVGMAISGKFVSRFGVVKLE